MKVIGLDIGFGTTKVAYDGGISVFPSVVGTDTTRQQVDGLLDAQMDVVTLDGRSYCVGAGAVKHSSRWINSRDRGWIHTVAFRALVTHALEVANARSCSVIIVTGLPITHYSSDRNQLVGIIRRIADAYSIDLTVKVILQPLGSFFRLLLNDEGIVADAELTSGKTGVLDIGFFTTDFLTLADLELMELQSDSCESGASTVLEAISTDIADQYGIRLDINAVENAVRNSSLRLYGKDVDISGTVDRRLSEFAAEITAKAKTVWKSAADIDRIIITGGGAELLKGKLDLYRHAFLCQNAQTANAEGYFRFGRRIANEKSD